MSISVKNALGSTVTINTINDLLAVLPTTLGQKTKAESLTVTLASDDNLLVPFGGIDDEPITDPEVDATLISLGKGNAELLAEVIALTGATGTQKVMLTNSTEAAIVTGPGTLLGVTIGTKGASSNVLQLYDSLTGSGTALGPPIDTTERIGFIDFGPGGVRFGTGLSAVMGTGTTAKLSIIYRAD